MGILPGPQSSLPLTRTPHVPAWMLLKPVNLAGNTPSRSKSGATHGSGSRPFLQFPPAARRVLYTTNSIESLNAQLRKATRNRGQFPNDAAALKTLWLIICNIEDKRAAQRAKKAKREIECNGYIEGAKATGWKQTINQLAVAYPDRFADYL